MITLQGLLEVPYARLVRTHPKRISEWLEKNMPVAYKEFVSWYQAQKEWGADSGVFGSSGFKIEDAIMILSRYCGENQVYAMKAMVDTFNIQGGWNVAVADDRELLLRIIFYRLYLDEL